MSFLRRAFEGRAIDDYQPVDTPGKWREGMVWEPRGGLSSVGTEQAMRLSAVFACLRILTDGISTLPVDLYARNGPARRPIRLPDYLYRLDAVDYLSQVVLSLLTDGNAFIATPRSSLGQPLQLIPLDPCTVTIEREHVGAEDTYVIGGKKYDRFDVMHIPGMKLPGQRRGVSPIAYARETVHLGLAAQRFGSAFFDNGALPSAVIEAPNDWSDGAAKRFSSAWYARHGGIGNANRVGVLTGGAKLSRVSVQPNEAQFLETRQFQVPDIARIFGVPPHLIADASNSTSWGSGLAEQNLAFGQFSLRPWITRIEQAHNRLLASDGMGYASFKLNLDALLRASLKDRYEAYKIGIDGGFLQPDEARATEDLPPLPTPPPTPSAPPAPPAITTTEESTP